MSAPFFLGRIIDVIYTNPSENYGDSLTRLCAALTCVFLCGAAANSIRVYLMQSSGQSPQVTKGVGSGLRVLLFQAPSLPTIALGSDIPPGRLTVIQNILYFLWSGLSR